jgi:hypothetical protein
MNVGANHLPPAMPGHRPNLKIALLLGAFGALAALGLMPYLLVLMPKQMAAIPLPIPVLAAIQAVQSAVLCWLLSWLGLYLGVPYGLDAPVLRSWMYRQPRDPSWRSRWWLAITLGVLAGALVLLLMHLGAKDPADHADTGAGWAWRGLLASFYGGVVEEVECRVLIVSAVVWLLARCNHRVAAPWMYALAIVIAALLFGAGHLPAVFATHPVHGPALIAHFVLLNALVGVVTGWLFWKYGLEHAMVAHFSADIVLHVIAPLAF